MNRESSEGDSEVLENNDREKTLGHRTESFRLINSSRKNINSSDDSFEASINKGLAKFSPELISEGTGGTYLLRDSLGEPLAVFKPADEEQNMPSNPKGFVGIKNSKTMERDIPSGTQHLREALVAAISPEFFDVPKTFLAEAQSPASLRRGSVQKYVNPVRDRKHSLPVLAAQKNVIFVQKIQKMALLDIMCLNGDRNLENLIITSCDENVMKLSLIDNGMTFPRELDIVRWDWCWLEFPAIREPVDDALRKFMKNLDERDFLASLEQHNLSQNSILLSELAIYVAKVGIKYGKTIEEIALYVCRSDYVTPSPFERMMADSFDAMDKCEGLDKFGMYSAEEQMFFINFVENLDFEDCVTEFEKEDVLEEKFGPLLRVQMQVLLRIQKNQHKIGKTSGRAMSERQLKITRQKIEIMRDVYISNCKREIYDHFSGGKFHMGDLACIFGFPFF